MGGFPLPGGEGEGKAEGQGSGEDETEEEEEEEDDGDSSGKEGGRPKRKRAARASAKKKAATGDGVVKSNSNAALAMLAGAAATKPPNPAAAAAAAAALQQNLGELWGTLNGAGAGGMPSTSGMDMSKLTSEQQQMLANASFEGITDEREMKRMRRKQSNRESARRSRLRKQAECEQLSRQVKDLASENSRLKEEKMQLLAQIEILNAKLSMSAFPGLHAMGGGDMTKQTAEIQAMAVAMAQTMQGNGGVMMGTGLGIPTLDAKAMEGGDEVAAVPAAMEGAGEQQEQPEQVSQ
ncbi:hypothetical protein CHLNCDRAFT_133990 [Chlorella variabilis]|uniref:BZIP domain-containing protein n=1 Tax=Chlorella variabilis TaxID=554065 RepID=E1ZER0_CHLVA|nr:hypothetical protein CHLNCDRAFT_133990 [Chlorella variabilis]EFN55702.1 hypothetical protein CHLNCDRAFT_133990 [Chlorella variabilis]|eukprot:XP_005847804.1 hypothetical protein CHLNCDRAFT_133990 [Chlorella variabilis]